MILWLLNKSGQVNCYNSGRLAAEETFYSSIVTNVKWELRLKNESTWSRVYDFLSSNYDDTLQCERRVTAESKTKNWNPGWIYTNVMCNRMTHHITSHHVPDQVPATRLHETKMATI